MWIYVSDWKKKFFSLFLFHINSEGDCTAASTTTYCTTTGSTCSVTSSSFTMVSRCNDKYADYLSLRYRCVPCKNLYS